MTERLKALYAGYARQAQDVRKKARADEPVLEMKMSPL